MHIESIPMWTGSSDNYAYLIIDDETKDAMVVDPASPSEVLPVLRYHISTGGINLKGIINTHHHYDHAGGNAELLAAFPDTPVYGGAQCPHKTHTPSHEETFKIGTDVKVTALHTPCHTRDSICYFMESGSEPEPNRAVFTGDTLFIAGCGRFFEGTAPEMLHALNTVLASLPDATKVYPGHEYTRSNVAFGQSILDSPPMQKLAQFCEENDTTEGRFTIADEKEHNVFMNAANPLIQKATGTTDPVMCMQKLRVLKNNFKTA